MLKKIFAPLVFIAIAGIFVFLPQSADSQTDPLNGLEKEFQSKIVGGTAASPAEYPWQVALVSASQSNVFFGQFCGGSLIARDWVLTAAHCLTGSSGDASPSEIDVVMGINNLSDGPTSGTQGVRRDVAQIILHPNYGTTNTEDSDIALLRLAEPVDLSCTINTIDYADNNDAALFAAGRTATITGWGTIQWNTSLYPDELREVSVPIVSNSTCQQGYGSFVTGNMICAGLASGGKDSCQGDSGGPLVVADGNRFVQAGVVSWGFRCAEPNFYGVYTRVSNYTQWINDWLATSRETPGISTDLNDFFATSNAYLPYVSRGLAPGENCS
ncbi:MAG: serine protease [Chloroflexota bacterium]